jgi:hypothetical protein
VLLCAAASRACGGGGGGVPGGSLVAATLARAWSRRQVTTCLKRPGETGAVALPKRPAKGMRGPAAGTRR